MAAEFFEISEDVIDLATVLIAQYHPSLLDARIAFIFRSEAQSSNGRLILGQASKVSEKHRTIADYHFLIWIAHNVWQALNPIQKKALLDHELCHCYMNDDGSAKMRPHDIEEFACIIDRYGFWSETLQRMAPAMESALLQMELPGIGEAVQALRRNGAVLKADPARVAVVEAETEVD